MAGAMSDGSGGMMVLACPTGPESWAGALTGVGAGIGA